MIARTPMRPGTQYARPTTPAASAALIPVSQWSAVTGPMTATSGASTMAGNGANGM